MWPLGEYHRLVHEIKRREDSDIPITFGLLVVDFRQQMSREYILNYINRFNYKSDRYINFYLPGYFEDDLYASEQIIKIGEKKYYFNEEKYMEFLRQLDTDFNLGYIYNPTLILMEYDRGHFSKAKRLYIELDRQGADIKSSGELFEEIFKIARQHVNIESFSSNLVKNDIKKDLFDKVVGIINNQFVTEIYNSRNALRKFKLK